MKQFQREQSKKYYLKCDVNPISTKERYASDTFFEWFFLFYLVCIQFINQYSICMDMWVIKRWNLVNLNFYLIFLWFEPISYIINFFNINALVSTKSIPYYHCLLSSINNYIAVFYPVAKASFSELQILNFISCKFSFTTTSSDERVFEMSLYLIIYWLFIMFYSWSCSI